MKVVYIAHPISGDIEGNLKKINKIVRDINLSMPNIVPFVPYYSDLMALDDNVPKERARGFKNNTHLLKSGIVEELWAYGDSEGVRYEISLCKNNSIPVKVKFYE